MKYLLMIYQDEKALTGYTDGERQKFFARDFAVLNYPFFGFQVRALCGAGRIGGRVDLFRLRRGARVGYLPGDSSLVAF